MPIPSDTLDVSNHDFATFAQANANCFYDSGARRLIVGCWDYEASKAIITRARVAGLVVKDLYCFVYYGLPWEMREVVNAVRLQQELGGILRAWPDCEAHFTPQPGDLDTEAPGITPEYRIEATWQARANLRTAIPSTGIYTGFDWWRDNMRNSDRFSKAGDPLWLAMYGANDGRQPPITELGIFTFGGWQRASVHQFTSTQPLCGRATRDFNYWNLGGSEMASAEYEELKAHVERLYLASHAGMEYGNSPRQTRLEHALYRTKIIAGESPTPAGENNRSLAQQIANATTRVDRLEQSGAPSNAVLYGVPIDIVRGKIERAKTE